MRKKILLTLIALLLLLILASGWLLGTQSGLNTAVKLSEKFVAGLEVGQARGRILGDLTLSRVAYRPQNASGAEIEYLQLKWQPSALFRATLLLETVEVEGVTVYTVATEPAESNQGGLPEIELPLQISLKQLSLKDIKMVDETGTTTPLVNQLQASANAGLDGLHIQKLNVERDDLIAALSGEVALQPPYPLMLNYEVTLKQALPEPLKLNGEAKGDIDKLTVNQAITTPLSSTQSLVVTDLSNDVKWTLSASAERVELSKIIPDQQTQFDGLKVTAEGNLESLKANLKSQVIQPQFPPVSIDANVKSEDFKHWQLAIHNSLPETGQLTLAGNVDISGAAPKADLTANWQNMTWPLNADDVLVSSPNGQLKLEGELDNYRAQLSSTLNWQQQTIKLAMDASGSMQELTVSSLNVDGFDGQLQASGGMNWQNSPLQYQLDANWQDITLPASLTTLAVALKKGTISLNGNPEMLKLATHAELQLDGVDATVDANGEGQTDKGFDNADLKLSLAEGTANYQGPLLWQGETLLDGKLSLNKINPGLLAADWPGSLSGSARLKVEQPAEGIQINASDIAISGDLRQRPVEVSGSVNYSDKLINVAELKVESGQSTLTADGQLLADNADFNWTLNSPDLQDFYPALSGKVDAKGQVKGSLEMPTLIADIKASKLRYGDISAEAIKADANITLSDNADIQLDVEGSELALPQLTADSLTLAVKGQQQQHTITLDMQSKPLTVALDASGSLSPEQIWQGELSTLTLSNDKAGQWQLSKHGPMTLSASEQNIPSHCWTASTGEFCIEAQHKQQAWQAAGHFAQVPLTLFEGFVTQLEQVQGKLRGDFDLTADNNAAIRGKGEVFLDEASVQLNQSALNQKAPIALNNVVLRYQIDEQQTTASLNLEPQLEGVSAIKADITTAGSTTLINTPEQASLKGKVSTSIADLSDLGLSHPAFSDLKGQLDMNVDLAGTLMQPEIDGKVRLRQGQVAITDAGIVLEQIDANVNGNLDQVDFDLQARSGKGTLTGEGQFKLTDASWALTANLNGKQLEVMNTPEALVIAEPNLEISVTPEKTQVKGKVHIPEAELEPTQFNSTVSPSSDVVVISDDDKAAETGPVTEVDVTVSLGDKVKLKAMGFQGRLAGELRVFGKTSDVLLGNGEIQIKDGSYIAYGQLLHIDDGAIRFAGGPIDNPELDIKAVRKGKDYEAGLHIEGFADSPQANLFSDPEMTQDNILSYILLGKPLEQASATDAALLASAATGMGLQNGAMIGDQIASTFGLDEFSIEGDSAENAALTVGKYLSPKLYLSYGIGVFESVSTVELRYQLSKIWALKAESGTESGVDLLYTHESGRPKKKQ